jgi:4-hydroxy-3-methylbut-2-enyl diphosphate reductase IspH
VISLVKQGEKQSEKQEIEEEERRVRTLRLLVDFSLAYLAQTKLSLEEAQAVVAGVKKKALHLFPEKEETFDLIYLPRFQRLLRDKYRLH